MKKTLDPKTIEYCTCMNPTGGKKALICTKCGNYRRVPREVCRSCEGPGWFWRLLAHKKIKVDCPDCRGTGKRLTKKDKYEA